MNWSWSAAEDSAMDYLPHRAQVMYLRILRRRMDFDTCIVGLTVRLSYQLIAEWLEERPAVRSTKPLVRLSVGEIRAVFGMLERVGLIERVLNEKNEVMPLVFKLPLARTGLIRPKYEQQMSNSKKGVCATAIDSADNKIIESLFNPLNSNASHSNAVVDKCDSLPLKITMNNSTQKHENAYEQQTSGKSSLSLNNNITTARGNGFLIPVDWLPSVDMVLRIVTEFGLPPEFLKSKAIEFRILWFDQGCVAVNWDFYFYGAVRNKIAECDGEFLTIQKQYRAGLAYE